MTTLNIRIDEKTKEKVAKKFASMGLGISAGTKLIYAQFLKEKDSPVRVMKDPKKIRAQWDRAVAQAIKSGKGFSSAKELMIDMLGKKEYERLSK